MKQSLMMEKSKSRLEVLTAALLNIHVSWHVKPYQLVNNDMFERS
jgi:hypothetical protein